MTEKRLVIRQLRVTSSNTIGIKKIKRHFGLKPEKLYKIGLVPALKGRVIFEVGGRR